MFQLDQIRSALKTFDPVLAPVGESTRQAAVAIILKTPARTAHADSGGATNVDAADVERRENQCEVLFIQRAERPGDPWSGHMAFPGGHLEAEDASLRHCAMRETLEEIGVSLEGADYLGALDHQQAQPKGRVLNMLIAPHVFLLHEEPAVKLNYEVAEVVWAPLNALAGNGLHATQTLPMSGKPTVFNGYRLEHGHFVWGLTYRILKSFFPSGNPQWQPPQEVE